MLISREKSRSMSFLLILLFLPSVAPQLRRKCMWDMFYDVLHGSKEIKERIKQEIRVHTNVYPICDADGFDEKQKELIKCFVKQDEELSNATVIDIFGGGAEPEVDDSVFRSYLSRLFPKSTSFQKLLEKDARHIVEFVVVPTVYVLLVIYTAYLLLSWMCCKLKEFWRKPLPEQSSEKELEPFDAPPKPSPILYSSSDIFDMLQNLRKELEGLHVSGEDLNIYLPLELLQSLATHISTDESLMRNLDLMNPSYLLQLGKYHASVNTRGSGDHKDQEVKVNIAVALDSPAFS